VSTSIKSLPEHMCLSFPWPSQRKAWVCPRLRRVDSQPQRITRTSWAVCFITLNSLKMVNLVPPRVSSDVVEPPSKFQILWEEMQSLYAARFRWGEKPDPSDFTSSIARSMQQHYPPDWTLSGGLLREVLPPPSLAHD